MQLNGPKSAAAGLPHGAEAPSSWVVRCAGLIATGGRALDLACGRGRHARLLRDQGCRVVALDRDGAALDTLRGEPGIEVLQADVESGPWPFAEQSFDAVVVTNYLHRPLFAILTAALRPGGVLVYETFALGNERHGRPSNPDFLLRPGELYERLSGALTVLAFEQGTVAEPRPAVIQRICAVRADTTAYISAYIPAAPRGKLGGGLG